MTIVIAGRIKVREDSKADALRRGAEMAAASRSETGCLDYRVGVDSEDSSVVMILEHWESEDALNAHMGAAHFQAFSEFIIGAVDGPVDLNRHEVTKSRPLFG